MSQFDAALEPVITLIAIPVFAVIGLRLAVMIVFTWEHYISDPYKRRRGPWAH
jgi:hypothetical protein